jgi:hypothetical protein
MIKSTGLDASISKPVAKIYQHGRRISMCMMLYDKNSKAF